MRQFDFIIQAIMLSAALLSLSTGKEAVIWIMFIQFFMGCWQVLSAIVSSIVKKSEQRKRQMLIYWLLVLGYFLVLGFLYVMDQKDFAFGWFFSAWGIAVYYMV